MSISCVESCVSVWSNKFSFLNTQSTIAFCLSLFLTVAGNQSIPLSSLLFNHTSA